jgi:hypothetical protein
MYRSEPLLAEVAARVTSQLEEKCPQFSLVELLQAFGKHIIQPDASIFIRTNKGDVGELMATVGLAFVIDAMRQRKVYDPNDHMYMSKPVNTAAFIRNILCKNETVHDFDFKHFEKFEINFTHFVHRELSDSNIELTYSQHAALFYGNYEKGIDLNIVMKYL